MENLKKMFANPDAEFRTAPLWVWNGDMTDSEIEKMLTELKSHGFGGAFVHPRPGMKVSYLDEPYFERWAKALDTAKKLGMKLNIYDENSYPSGFGGGHVSSELPDCLSEAVQYQVFAEEEMDFTDEKSDWLGSYDLLAVYACEKSNEKMIYKQDVTELPRSLWKGKGKYYVILTHLTSQTAGWLAGFADVDRLRPEVTKMFLDKVYNKYAAHFQQDFGDTIQSIFTDEPSLPGSTVYGRGGQDSIPMNHWFAYEFYKKKKYDILKYLPSLFEDWEGVENEKIRHDYYEVTQELWTENFLIPICDWCREHKIRFTGHFMEDGWPKPYYCVVSPSVMSYYEYQDWPGIDLLLSGRLKNQPSEVQEISILEVMSAAHQFGKERVFCEAFGAGGYDSGLVDYKRIGDYLLVNGVNYINEHLSYTSYVGARKRDHPQSFDWRQPWWEDYTGLNDYFGRMSAVLSAGKSEERILVLNPTMTGYLYPKDADSSQLVHNVLAEEPNMRPFLQMIQDLRKSQWDINLGDEIILKRHGVADCGKIEVVQQTYDVVILHECIKNILPSTLKLLQVFLEQGGIVLSVGRPGDYVSGVHNKEAYAPIFASQNYIEFDSSKEMLTYLDIHYQPYFTTEDALPEGVRSIRRALDGGQELFFITNHSQEDICTMADFRGAYLEEWNPWQGTAEMAATGDSLSKIKIQLCLKAGESRLYCVYHEKTGVEITTPQAAVSLRKEEWKADVVRPLEENVWPLEYCDLSIDGETTEQYSAIAAGIQVFRKRGFHGNPWDNEVQYKTRTYDRNQFYGENSGFTAVYSFQIASGFQPGKLALSVEYGERYDIQVNGQPVERKREDCFLDELIRQYEIQHLVKEGHNEIVLKAKEFDVELELEAVILRGDFGVYNVDEKWVMDAQRTILPGSWIWQGYPFYFGTMEYAGDVVIEGKERIFVGIADTEATAVSVWIGDKKVSTANINGIKDIELTKYLETGKNPLQIRMSGSMKNLLGPHFDPARPRRTAWPDMWKKAPAFGEPNPSEYDLIPYGMSAPVTIYKEEC